MLRRMREFNGDRSLLGPLAPLVTDMVAGVVPLVYISVIAVAILNYDATALQFAAKPISVSEHLREDSDDELGDVAEDLAAAPPSEVADPALLPSEIKRLLSPLDEREREILKFRYLLREESPPA